MERSSDSTNSYTLPALGDLSDGHFADSLRKAVTQEDDDDIDLDFDGRDSTAQGFRLNASSLAKNPNTSVDLALLRQPLLLSFLQHGKPSTPSAANPTPGSLSLPVPHSAISRVIVNTMGRLGRWKRVLNARSQTRAPLGSCVDVSGFDIEGVGSDLMLMAGGVEQYLKSSDGQITQLRAIQGALAGHTLPALQMSPPVPSDATPRLPSAESPSPPSATDPTDPDAAGVDTQEAVGACQRVDRERIPSVTRCALALTCRYFRLVVL